jgi:hypothetical protein
MAELINPKPLIDHRMAAYHLVPLNTSPNKVFELSCGIKLNFFVCNIIYTKSGLVLSQINNLFLKKEELH